MTDSHSAATGEFRVQYKNETYDLQRFLRKHPGGIGTLSGLRNRDLTNIMSKDPVHSDAAFYLMKEYKVEKENSEQTAVGRGKNVKQPSNGYVTGNGHACSEQDNTNGLVSDNISSKVPDKADTGTPADGDDDRLESLVNWNKAMLPQIPRLGDKYDLWVNSPVDRHLRLFGPWYLECLTKTPWWLVPLFWIPCISYLLLTEYLTISSTILGNQLLYTVLRSFFGGILVWTIVEYVLHRYVFHMDTKDIGDFAKIFHFLLHGLHHKVPTDPYRLVFPPIPGLIIATTIYYMCHYLFNYPRLVLAGSLSGYLIYDMIHYYLHYGSPSTKGVLNKYLYHIKRYHYQHHFVHHDKGFGISSPLWDYAFQTDIVLRKLNFTLKW